MERQSFGLSFVQLIELRQHRSPTEREGRYEALGHFLPIRTTMNLVDPQEVVIDVVEREILPSAMARLQLDHPILASSELATRFRSTPSHT
jgi:hypothetical protein